jgi:Fic family protein
MSDIRKQRWSSGFHVQTTKVPWDERSVKEWEESIESINKTVCELGEDPQIKRFRIRQFGNVAYDANRLEGTLQDKDLEGNTMASIRNFVDDVGPFPDEIAWDSEGGRELYQKSTARQMYQFVKAVKYLLMENLSSPLSINLLIQTHRIMMEGSCNAEGKSITVGELRTSIVSAGFHEFLPPENVEGALRKLINQYEEKRENTHSISLATFLFQDLISIHPFVNGNGRLCRLFLSWSLMRDGLPFPISFTCGHKNRRKHYIHAIEFARRPSGHHGHLNDICITSLESCLGSIMTNIRLSTA